MMVLIRRSTQPRLTGGRILVPVVEGLGIDPTTYAVHSITRPAGPALGACVIDTVRNWDEATAEVPPGTEIWVYDELTPPRRTLFHGWVVGYNRDMTPDTGRAEYGLIALDAGFRLADMGVYWPAHGVTPAKVARVLWDGYTLSVPAYGYSVRLLPSSVDGDLIIMGTDLRDLGVDIRARSYSFTSGVDALQALSQAILSIPQAVWWIEPAQERGEPDLVRVALRGEGEDRRVFMGGTSANVMAVRGNTDFSRVRNRIRGVGDRKLYENTDVDPAGKDLTLKPLWDQSLETEYLKKLEEADSETGQETAVSGPWARVVDPKYFDVAKSWGLPRDIRLVPAYEALAADLRTRNTARTTQDALTTSRPELWMRRSAYKLAEGGADTDWRHVTIPYRIETVESGPNRPEGDLSGLVQDVQGDQPIPITWRIVFDSPQLYNANAETTVVNDRGQTVPAEPDWKIPEFQITLGAYAPDDTETGGRLTVASGYESGAATLPWQRSAVIVDTSYHHQQVDSRRVKYAEGEPDGYRRVRTTIDDSPRFAADIRRQVAQTGRAVEDLTVELDGTDLEWTPGQTLVEIQGSQLGDLAMTCVSTAWEFGGDISSGPSGSDKTVLRFENLAGVHV